MSEQDLSITKTYSNQLAEPTRPDTTSIDVPIGTVEAIDSWISQQREPRPTRADAISSLVGEALATRAKRNRIVAPESRWNDPTLLVSVRRHPNDWKTAQYHLIHIENLHMNSVSGGVGRRTARPGVCGYVWCDGIVSGRVAHSCRHGPPPHRIKVFLPKVCNKETWKAIEARLEKDLQAGRENAAKFLG